MTAINLNEHYRETERLKAIIEAKSRQIAELKNLNERLIRRISKLEARCRETGRTTTESGLAFSTAAAPNLTSAPVRTGHIIGARGG